MKSMYRIVCMITMLALAAGSAQALTQSEAITAVADRLVAEQAVDGSWSGETDLTGSIVAGLANAYEITGNAAYLNAAEAGGSYILNNNGANPFGDEAYALARLSEVTGNSTYSDTVKNFYNGLDTYGYIRGFKGTDTSNAVFYVAEHTVAAHKVGADNAGVWRNALVEFLARVDDDAALLPVQSLGIATWALAETGAMDGTRVDPFGLVGEDVWQDVVLSDLGAMLAGHQDSASDTFFHRFDHAAAGPGYEANGYVEDTVFGILGLEAAGSYSAEILAGRAALVDAIAADGIVYENLLTGGEDFNVFAGEWLQAVPEPATMLLLGVGGLMFRRKRS